MRARKRASTLLISHLGPLSLGFVFMASSQINPCDITPVSLRYQPNIGGG
jgi:hypothetical protein